MGTSLRIISASGPASGGQAARPTGLHQALEQAAPVGAADQRVDQVLRVRHQPEHVERVGVDAAMAFIEPLRLASAVTCPAASQ